MPRTFKVIGFSCSPRRGGNTDILVQQVLRTANEAWRRSDLIVFSSPAGSQGHFTYATKKFEGLHRRAEREGERTELENERFQRYRGKIHFLADLLTDKVPQRTTPSQITLMNKNWGLGIEFASVAKLVYDRACADGIGEEIPIEWFSQTSHP